MHVAQTGLPGLLAASAHNVEETAHLLDALLADYPAQAALAEDIQEIVLRAARAAQPATASSSA